MRGYASKGTEGAVEKEVGFQDGPHNSGVKACSGSVVISYLGNQELLLVSLLIHSFCVKFPTSLGKGW